MKHLRPIPLLITLVLALLLVSGALAIRLAETTHLLSINDFESCQEAGFPILEIYPEICVTSDGRQFTRDISQDSQRPPLYPELPDGPIPVEPDYPIGGPVDSVPPAEPDQQIFCTLDAKICPDGSSVGRQGPNCEFAPCPGE